MPPQNIVLIYLVQKLKFSFLNWSMANKEWNKLMLSPEAQKVQRKPKGDANIMKLLWFPFTEMSKQMRKIFPRFYSLF